MAGARETLSLSEAVGWLEGVAGELESVSFREPLEACHVLLRSSILENFATSTSPDGTSMLPLKHPRHNSKGDDKPLLDTGILEAASTGGSGGSTQITDTELIMSNNLEYAAVHQYGSTHEIPEHDQVLLFKPGGKFAKQKGKYKSGTYGKKVKVGPYEVTIPARPYMGFKPADVEAIGLIFSEWIDQKLR